MFDKKNTEDFKLLAPKCPRNYVCLKQANGVLCNINYCVNDKVLFVKPVDDSFCPYINAFGYSHFCTCTIRMQIYLESKNDFN